MTETTSEYNEQLLHLLLYIILFILNLNMDNIRQMKLSLCKRKCINGLLYMYLIV